MVKKTVGKKVRGTRVKVSKDKKVSKKSKKSKSSLSKKKKKVSKTSSKKSSKKVSVTELEANELDDTPLSAWEARLQSSRKHNSPEEIHNQQLRYLEKFAETGRHDLACAYSGCGPTYVYKWRKSNEEFAKAYLEAREASVQNLEAHAIKRGTVGCRKAVYFHGDVVGYENVYSDGLLQFMLKARDPSTYRERVNLAGHDGGPLTQPTKGLTSGTANFIRADVLGVDIKGGDDGDNS